MTEIIVGEDCGIAPKMALLKKFNIALAKGELEILLQQLANDIHWDWVGEQVIEGKDDVAIKLKLMMQTKRQS